jgi:hypothetical protein
MLGLLRAERATWCHPPLPILLQARCCDLCAHPRKYSSYLQKATKQLKDPGRSGGEGKGWPYVPSGLDLAPPRRTSEGGCSAHCTPLPRPVLSKAEHSRGGLLSCEPPLLLSSMESFVADSGGGGMVVVEASSGLVPGVDRPGQWRSREAWLGPIPALPGRHGGLSLGGCAVRRGLEAKCVGGRGRTLSLHAG